MNFENEDSFFWEEQYVSDEVCMKVVLDPNLELLGIEQLVKGTDGAAAYDIRSAERKVILPGQTEKVYTGFKLDMPSDVYLEIFSRSGRTLEGMVVANGVGVIDSDYRGYIFVLLHNRSSDIIRIQAGERIAQGIFKRSLEVNLDRVSVIDYNMTKSARGEGGLGSTGNS